jgi:tetratricopeptide (TPR) repeat protein
MGELLRQINASLGRAVERFGEFLQSFDPTSWVAWLQIASLTLAILWTLYQFTRARRLSEGEVEAWIEEHLDDKPRNLMNERAAYLSHFDSATNGSLMTRGLRALRARAKMVVLFLLRVILVRKRKPSAAHALLLFDAGKDARAGAEFNAIAADFEKMVRIYEKQVRAKRLEACNAYLYAGRVASEIRDAEGTKRAYDNVLRLNDGDLDAYKLIGRQYLEAGNIPAALREYASIAARAEKAGDKVMEAEAYRLQATAHLRDNRTGRARRMLARSEKIEPPSNHQGLAETQRMLGDLFVRQGMTAAAATAYTNSVTNYRQAGNRAVAAEVQDSLDRIGREEGWAARMLEHFGQLMLRLAKRFRDRGQRK